MYVCMQIVLRCHTHFPLGVLCTRLRRTVIFSLECSLPSTSVGGWEEDTEAGPGVLWRSGRCQVGSLLRPVKGRQKRAGVGQRALDQTGPATDNDGGLRARFHFCSSVHSLHGLRTSGRFGGQWVGIEASKRLKPPPMLLHGKTKRACEILQRPKTPLRAERHPRSGFGGERTGRRRMVRRGLRWKGFSAHPAAAFASLPPGLCSILGVAAARPSRGCAYITARRVLLPGALGSRGRGGPPDRDAAGTSAAGPGPGRQAEEREHRREEGAGGGGGEGQWV